MPIVTVKLIRGRTLSQKRKLVEGVTQAIARAIDVDPENIWIDIQELDRTDFANGGVLHSDRTPDPVVG